MTCQLWFCVYYLTKIVLFAQGLLKLMKAVGASHFYTHISWFNSSIMAISSFISPASRTIPASLRV